MATSYTSLLGLALPVTGEVAGTWGETVNNSITSLLDTAVAGTTTLSTDADVTLTTTTGASNQARQAILLCSGARTALRTITAPAQSKIYVVINSTTGGFGVKLVGAGPTTGITVAAGKTAVLVWNGSDFVEVAPATATTATNLAGGVAGSLPYQTAASTTTFLGIGAQYRVLTSTGSAPQWATELRNLTLLYCDGNISARSMTVHPSLSGKIGSNDLTVQNVNGGICSIGLPTLGSGFTTLGTLNFVSSGSTVRGGIACAEEASAEAAGLGFSTRNAAGSVGERMRITSAGNVGIGVTAPGAKLEVESGAGVRATYAADADDFAIDGPGNTGLTISSERASLGSIIFADNDSNFRGGVQYTHATNDLYLSTSGTERLRIDSAGNVGIGITAPGALLDVASATGGVLRLTSTDTSIVAADELLGKVEMFASDASLGGTAVGASISALSEGAFTGAGTPTYLALATAPSGGTVTERMRITSAGNVGIGTTSPASIFHVRYISTSPVPRIAGSAAGTLMIEDEAVADASRPFQYLQSDDGSLIFGNANRSGTATTGSVERMRIDSSGNLGLGTTTPNTRLTVAASGSTPAEILRTTSTASAATYVALQAYNASSAAVTYASFGSIIEANTAGSHSGAFVINTVSAAAITERLRITANGTLGLGVVPSAWDTTYAAMQIKSSGGPSLSGAVADMNLASNAYYEAAWKYGTSSQPALRYTHNNGQHQWFNAPSGTAGNTITFTQAMTLDASGNLGIGTASPVNKLQINGSLGRNAPVTKTGNFTLADTENWLICNGTGTITVTLPAASSWTGREVMIKTIAAFTVVSASSNVVPLAGGAAGTAILAATAGRFATLVSDGTNWIIMQAN